MAERQMLEYAEAHRWSAWELTESLDAVEEILDRAREEAEKSGYTKLRLEFDSAEHYGDGQVRIVLVGSRLETQEEMWARLAKEKDFAARTEELELKALERLRAKYGKDVTG